MEGRKDFMVEKAVIRIGCILLSLVVITGCVLYLSSDNINRPYYEKKLLKATNDPYGQQNTQNTYVQNSSEPEEIEQNKYENKNNNNKTVERDNNSNEIINNTDNTTHERETSSNNPKKPIYVECEIPDAIVSYSKASSASSKTVSSNISESSSTAPISSSESSSQIDVPSSTPQQIITAETNNEIALSITKAYEITVIIARSSKDYRNQNIINYARDEYQINQNLLVVSRFLALLPQGFLADFDIKQIVLVDEHRERTIVMQSTKDIILSCKKEASPNEIKCEVNQIITRYIIGKIDKDSFKGRLSVYNPSHFLYGLVSKDFIYSEKNLFNGYFLNEKAQLSEIDDASELCYYILSNSSDLVLISKESRIYPKLVVMCEVIRKEFPTYKQIII